jgi:hypothetical protein
MTRRVFTLCCIIGLAAASIVALLAAWYRESALANERHVLAANSIHSVTVALSMYDSLEYRLPPSAITDPVGVPLLSWRAAVLYPHLTWRGGLDGQFNLGAVDFTRRWDDPVNRSLAMRPQGTYCFRSYGSPEDSFPTDHHSNVMAIVGAGTAFEADVVLRFGDLHRNTILVMEVDKSDCVWMAPCDVEVSRLASEQRPIQECLPRGLVPTEFNVGFADHSVWRLSSSVPGDMIARFSDVKTAPLCDRDRDLGPFCLGRYWEE